MSAPSAATASAPPVSASRELTSGLFMVDRRPVVVIHPAARRLGPGAVLQALGAKSVRRATPGEALALFGPMAAGEAPVRTIELEPVSGPAAGGPAWRPVQGRPRATRRRAR